MTIESYRFRNEGELVILQVCERTRKGPYDSYDKVEWRDAKTQDLLDVARLIRPETVCRFTENKIDTRGFESVIDDECRRIRG